MFFLSAHYSHPIDYNDKKIEESRQALDRIANFVFKARDIAYSNVSISSEITEINEIKNEFVKAMDDDFNTPQALSAIFDLVNLTYKNMDNAVFVKTSEKVLEDLSAILGLSVQKLQFDNVEEITSKIEARNSARKQGKFALADQIRKKLEEEGIILEDSKDGKTSWRKKL
jgi:cysteinyl-tRNA synthetase